MRGIGVIALVAGVLAVTGCGGSEPSEREEVTAYIRSVSAVTRSFALPFKQANEAYVAFTRSEIEQEVAVTRLERAHRDIEAARVKVTALRAPPAARRLHSQVIRLFDMNLAFASETLSLARYVPGADKALEPLDEVGTRLRRRLRAPNQSVNEQARALERFVQGINGILTDLRRLEVPLVLRPTHGDQVRSLQGSRDLAEALAQALRQRDAERVARLLDRFRSSLSERKPRRKLAAQAIKQYNRRYRALSDAYTDLAREETRLDRTLE